MEAHSGRKSAGAGLSFLTTHKGLVAPRDLIYVNEKRAVGLPVLTPQFLGGVAQGAGSVGGSWLMAKLLELTRRKKDEIVGAPQLKVGKHIGPNDKHKLNHPTDGPMKRSAVGESGLILGERDWYLQGPDAWPDPEPVGRSPVAMGHSRIAQE